MLKNVQVLDVLPVSRVRPKFRPGRTGYDTSVEVPVAVVSGATHGVDPRLLTRGHGTDEGPVPGDELVFWHAHTALDHQLIARPAHSHEAHAVRGAGGVASAAVAVALERCVEET